MTASVPSPIIARCSASAARAEATPGDTCSVPVTGSMAT